MCDLTDYFKKATCCFAVTQITEQYWEIQTGTLFYLPILQSSYNQQTL